MQLSGEHAGRWRDWAEEGRHGDLLDLWAAARGIPLAEAFREAKEYLGMLGPEPATASPRKYQAPPVREQAGVIPVAEEGVVMRVPAAPARAGSGGGASLRRGGAAFRRGAGLSLSCAGWHAGEPLLPDGSWTR
ncbi:hypothetical protein [Verrucomicrobium spinosum]|uniref:hypothetical protein n=1 Tax=Verrucomicrobium spinosum TaxID=2736 RepID=UPI0009463468|nr:hypothetical protein [Verrucomicrobium spinosum]